MKCRKVRKLLPAYLEHLLGLSRREQVAQHLRHCVTCRAELLAYQTTLDMTGTVEVEYPSDEQWKSFLPELYARIESEKSQHQRRHWYWQPERMQPTFKAVLISGCLLLALFAGFQIQNWITGTVESSQPSPLEVISATLINDVEARELVALDTPTLLEDPFTLTPVVYDTPRELAKVELQLDLATIEETLRLPEDELWQVVAHSGE